MWTYNDLGNQISESSKLKDSVVALVAVFGPYPFFRYPLQDEAIPQSVRRIWFMERNENISLVVVRKPDEDVVVPIPILEKNNQTLMIDLITTATEYSPISIKDYSGQVDVKHWTVKEVKAISRKASPTLAFMEIISGNFEFLSQFRDDDNVTKAWRFLHTRGVSLVQRASDAAHAPLQLIHLARAILHLIVSAQETVYKNRDSAGMGYCTELHRLIDGLENRIESQTYTKSFSDGDFSDLCDDRPGAVVVRQSYSIFSDLSSTRPVIVPRLRPESVSFQEDEAKHSPAKDSKELSEGQLSLQRNSSKQGGATTAPVHASLPFSTLQNQFEELSLSASTQNDPSLSTITNNPQQQLWLLHDFSSRVEQLDRFHQAFIRHHSGPTFSKNLIVLEFVERYQRNNGGALPMAVTLNPRAHRSNAAPEQVQCNICGYRRRTVEKIAAHLLLAHIADVADSEDNWFHCRFPKCTATFKRGEDLEKHRQNAHTFEEPLDAHSPESSAQPDVQHIHESTPPIPSNLGGSIHSPLPTSQPHVDSPQNPLSQPIEPKTKAPLQRPKGKLLTRLGTNAKPVAKSAKKKTTSLLSHIPLPSARRRRDIASDGDPRDLKLVDEMTQHLVPSSSRGGEDSAANWQRPITTPDVPHESAMSPPLPPQPLPHMLPAFDFMSPPTGQPRNVVPLVPQPQLSFGDEIYMKYREFIYTAPGDMGPHVTGAHEQPSTFPDAHIGGGNTTDMRSNDRTYPNSSFYDIGTNILPVGPDNFRSTPHAPSLFPLSPPHPAPPNFQTAPWNAPKTLSSTKQAVYPSLDHPHPPTLSPQGYPQFLPSTMTRNETSTSNQPYTRTAYNANAPSTSLSPLLPTHYYFQNEPLQYQQPAPPLQHQLHFQERQVHFEHPHYGYDETQLMNMPSKPSSTTRNPYSSSMSPIQLLGPGSVNLYQQPGLSGTRRRRSEVDGPPPGQWDPTGPGEFGHPCDDQC
ncbi:hypothetical protein FRC17_011187 [Serendipita sp. 399]|nr:hypothetical protein FRC17_011187 [Serendipita sp. 399]